ncbi:S8/S53 family peptidase [Candidatus Contubernalis alkaliaceticus]|uniref:S8/S53 family peptidase n=1 Tax=Candidatus Contubernalis alkaliaceticus TaxID=338645 RepID=UPI001F4C0F57|nr:S8/S53 family peptidase [Candidatus Contubernalis alkalaceticus]UNC92716.1 S8/S53 family peptidase [Candidatus Contubernalis alkalaceticus]
MLEQNLEKFNYCGILNYHDLGFKGQNIKVAILEDEADPEDHAKKVENLLWQIAPEAEIHFRNHVFYNYNVDTGEIPQESLNNITDYYQSLVNEGFDMLVLSEKKKVNPDFEDILIDTVIENGLYFTVSAGNDNSTIPPDELAGLSSTISVGAVFTPSGVITKFGYSNDGELLDVYGFANLLLTDGFVKDYNAGGGVYFSGTSCANPFFAGLLILYLNYCDENNIDRPTYPELRDLINANGEEIDEYAKLFILPEIEEVVIPISIQKANEYFENRLFSDSWDNSTTTKKEKALKTAEQIIINQFDLREDVLESDAYDHAVYEQAIHLLNFGRDRYQLQQEGVTNYKVDDISITMSNSLISPVVKGILKPYIYKNVGRVV